MSLQYLSNYNIVPSTTIEEGFLNIATEAGICQYPMTMTTLLFYLFFSTGSVGGRRRRRRGALRSFTTVDLQTFYPTTGWQTHVD